MIFIEVKYSKFFFTLLRIYFFHFFQYTYQVQNANAPFSRFRLDEQSMYYLVHVPAKAYEIVVFKILIIIFVQIEMMQLPQFCQLRAGNLTTIFLQGLHVFPEFFPPLAVPEAALFALRVLSRFWTLLGSFYWFTLIRHSLRLETGPRYAYLTACIQELHCHCRILPCACR